MQDDLQIIVDLAGGQQLFDAAWRKAKAADGSATHQIFKTLQVATISYVEPVVSEIFVKAGLKHSPIPPIYIPVNDPAFPESFKTPVRITRPTLPPLPSIRSRERPRKGGQQSSLPETAVSVDPKPIDPTVFSWQLDACSLRRGIATLDGDGIKVGVADTGIAGSHTAFDGAQVHFRDTVFKGDRIELAAVKAVDSSKEGHGTMVASIIAAQTYNGFRWGLAPRCALHVVDVTRDKASVWNANRLLAALEWFAAEKVRIACITRCGDTTYESAHDLICCAARRCSMLPMAAAGNLSCGNIVTPAASQYALSVGALSDANTVAPISGCKRAGAGGSLNPVPKLLAPGSLEVAVPTESAPQLTNSFTSFATPFATGIATLLVQACPSASVDQLEAALMTTVRTAGRAGCACPAAGVVDFEAAYATLHKFGLKCLPID